MAIDGLFAGVVSREREIDRPSNDREPAQVPRACLVFCVTSNTLDATA